MDKIACYIRVSTDKEDQVKSLEQQGILLEEEYKGKEIKMYSDTGTGTSFKRKGFQQMMYDAGLNLKELSDGRITFEADKVREPIFKEIVVINTSRFSRNIAIVDILRLLWDYKKVNVKFLDSKKNSNNQGDMILLQMFFAMAENEVVEISKRTKRGNKTSILRNRIRNNSIFGWNFNREKNYLKINEEEAKVVEFIYKTSLEYGLKLTAKLTNEMGYRTKKGNLWTDSTIKTLIVNPKYKGFNVRQKYNNINLFTESKTKYVRKENWIIQKSDNIEPIVSEELWQRVQDSLAYRCINGNKGRNSRTYDTRGKLKCAKCGGSYIRAVEKKISQKKENAHYLICSNKKKHTKAYCDSENINIGILDKYIEKERKAYYRNMKKQIESKIKKMEKEIQSIGKGTASEVNRQINLLEKERKELNGKLDKLVEKFIDMDGSLEIIVNEKIDTIRKRLREIDREYRDLKNKVDDSEKYKRELKVRIIKSKEQIKTIPTKILSRKEWLDMVESIFIKGKSSIETKYKI